MQKNIPVFQNLPGMHHIFPTVLHWQKMWLLVVVQWLSLVPVIDVGTYVRHGLFYTMQTYKLFPSFRAPSKREY